MKENEKFAFEETYYTIHFILENFWIFICYSPPLKKPTFFTVQIKNTYFTLLNHTMLYIPHTWYTHAHWERVCVHAQERIPRDKGGWLKPLIIDIYWWSLLRGKSTPPPQIFCVFLTVYSLVSFDNVGKIFSITIS